MMKKFNLTLCLVFAGMAILSGQTKDEVIAKFNVGAEDVNKGNFTTAIEHFNEVLTMGAAVGAESADLVAKAKEQLPLLHYQVAIGFIKQKNYEPAIPYLKKTIELSDLYGNNAEFKGKAANMIPQLAAGVGTLKFRDKNYKEALEMFDLTLSYDARNAKAFLGKGLVYNDMEEGLKMIENLEKAIEYSAKDNDVKTADLAKQTLGRYFVNLGNEEFDAVDPADPDYTYAIENYEKALSYDDSNTDAHFRMAVIYNRLVEYDKAIEQCLKALETETIEIKIAAIYLELGSAYVGNADYDKACEAFGKAMVGDLAERATARKEKVPGCE